MSIIRYKLIFLTGILLLVNLAGCTSNKAVTEDPRLLTPEKTYNFWIETAINKDLETSLLCITAESKQTVNFQGAAREVFLERLYGQAKFFKEYRVADISYKEDRAIILLKGPKDNSMVVPFKKEAEGWKVDMLAMFNR